MNDVVTCISCPLGCRIHVNKKEDDVTVAGHQCKKGEEYAIQEINDPRRILTTTVKLENIDENLLPVRSKEGIPKDLIRKSVIELSKIKVKSPIKCGDLIYKNILETGVDIIASRDIETKTKKMVYNHRL